MKKVTMLTVALSLSASIYSMAKHPSKYYLDGIEISKEKYDAAQLSDSSSCKSPETIRFRRISDLERRNSSAQTPQGRYVGDEDYSEDDLKKGFDFDLADKLADIEACKSPANATRVALSETAKSQTSASAFSRIPQLKKQNSK